MSACDAVGSILDLYREGRLTKARAAEVSAHLEACPACSGRLAREAPPRAKAVRAPAGFASALKARLAAASPLAPAPEPLSPAVLLKPAALAAAGAALVLAAGALWPGPASQRPPSEAGLSVAEAP